MPEYRVIGLDRETGEERDLTLTANSEDDAVKKAGDLRVVVERCVEKPASTASRSGPPTSRAGQAGPARSSAATGVGIAALVVGIIALLGAWVPLVGLLSFPLAFMGGLLAFIGLIIGFTSRAKDFAFPLAAIITCILAGVVSLLSTGTAVSGMTELLRQANEDNPNQTASEDEGASQSRAERDNNRATLGVEDSRARAILSRFELLSSRFYWSETRFTDEPVIELKVRNGTDTAVSRAYFNAEVRSPRRSIPWVSDQFNYEISGGLEPGETATWKLAPNPFSDWGNVPKDRDDLQLHAEVYALDGPDGETLAEIEVKP